MPSIERKQWNETVALVTAVNGAGFVAITMAGFAAGKVYVPAGSAITTLTFYSCKGVPGQPLRDGTVYSPTFTQCYDKSNAALSWTVAAGRDYPLPVELFSSGQIQIVANSAGNVDVSLQG